MSDTNLDQVAAAKRAVDREVEQGAVSQPMLAAQHEADFPYLWA